MKLYDTPMAPNPQRVRIFLAEKGIEVPTVEVNLMKGEHRSDDYRKIAPNMRVPALELDDGTIILESVAICRYFEEIQPEPPLFGTGAVERAQVEAWNRRMELEFFMPTAMTFRHLHPAGAALEGQISEYGESQKAIALKRMDILDKELADKEFIAGNNFTVADITAAVTIGFGKVSKHYIAEDQKNLARWYDQVSARPSMSA